MILLIYVAMSGEAMAVVGAGIAAFIVTVISIAVLAALMGGWKLVRERRITVAGIAVAAAIVAAKAAHNAL